MSRVLVIDAGTTSVRAAVVDEEGRLVVEKRQVFAPSIPAPGLVEFDPIALVGVVLDTCSAALEEAGPVLGVGLSNQRASTVVWERATGTPVGPGLGWQDLRTLGDCLALRSEGLRLAPNQTATKARWLMSNASASPDELLVGTVDSWIVWNLSAGARHVTDLSNAMVTGLCRADGSGWDEKVLESLSIPAGSMAEIVDSTGVAAEAVRLPGAPPVCGISGDQQASLVGQSCVAEGQAKITFGTGGMLDMRLGSERPISSERGPEGCFPIVCWRDEGGVVWGLEAIMLSAGGNVEWLRDDLGLISSVEESHDLAASVPDSGGVFYVPAQLGLGTPNWDYGARGLLIGLTRGTTAAHVARAVLEGVANLGADLVEAAEKESGVRLASLRVDGGMSRNPTFVQALADAAARPVEVSPVTEATALGAGYLAGLACGLWSGWEEIADLWRPGQVVEPRAGHSQRAAWKEAVGRSLGWVPELSTLDF
ncbi:MAG: glycerol kinase [Acidimicrobiales bacterium]|nr:MAG: glycerol kinase [Acidimicrobiales bacterium]